MKKLRDLKKVLSYLELEEQGRGIIMEVTSKMACHTKYFRHQCIYEFCLKNADEFFKNFNRNTNLE
jgi:hypothetical protein